MHTSEHVAHTPLVKVGETPSTRAYVQATWERREFAAALAAGELRSENMDTALGSVWHLLNPLLLVAVYYLIFGVMLEVDRDVDNFIAFLTIGVFTFHYTQKSVIGGAKSIISRLGLLRSIAFPRAVLPMATVGAQTLAFVPAVGVILLITLLTGESVHPTWPVIGAVFALQAVFNLGAVFLVARLTEGFHDVQQILPYLFRILFYVSGILYPVSTFVTDPGYRLLFDFNPMYVFPTLVRGPLLEGSLDLRLAAIAVGWTVVMVVVGFVAFRRAEHRYGRG